MQPETVGERQRKVSLDSAYDHLKDRLDAVWEAMFVVHSGGGIEDARKAFVQIISEMVDEMEEEFGGWATSAEDFR